jgi:hypothetical protein
MAAGSQALDPVSPPGTARITTRVNDDLRNSTRGAIAQIYDSLIESSAPGLGVSAQHSHRNDADLPSAGYALTGQQVGIPEFARFYTIE